MSYLSMPFLKDEGGSVELDNAARAPEPPRQFHPQSVGKLIEALRAFRPDQRVMVKGYESGFDDPEPLRIVKVRVDPWESSVYGDYEEATDDRNAFDVVLIDRRS